jgi:hypothetical protein
MQDSQTQSESEEDMGSIYEWAVELFDRSGARICMAIEQFLGGVFAVCGFLFAVLMFFTIFG